MAFRVTDPFTGNVIPPSADPSLHQDGSSITSVAVITNYITQPVPGTYYLRFFATPAIQGGVGNIVQVDRLEGGYSRQAIAVNSKTYTWLIPGLTIILATVTNGDTAVIHVPRSLNSAITPWMPELHCADKIMILYNGTFSANQVWSFPTLGYSSYFIFNDVTAVGGAGSADAGMVNEISNENILSDAALANPGSGIYTAVGPITAIGRRASSRGLVKSPHMALFQRIGTFTSITGTWWVHLSTVNGGLLAPSSFTT